ncbi:MAG TPA: 3-hydroxyacyl-CoA dehydrogenase family protein [Thermodesulfobacteriota bacterium]|nr:3-hydroxyacyl-CoA dehydrogenase family protein [Thermodesulfobacteriota bacterium]
MKEIRTTLVVGAGTMGHGFAQIFALNHVPVRLTDETDELLKRAHGWIIDNLNTMVELGEVERKEVESVLTNIQFTTDLKKAAQEVDYVLEAVSENLDLKKGIFQQLGGYTQPHAILASNTSSFDINELSAVTVHPQRVIGTHWYHPPQITPCVEVIPSKTTDQQTIQRTMGFMERIGKVPTLCKSAPGFVGNRIQFAMAAEALAIVDEGLATPEEVDRIVKTSFGFRLGAYGPFEICDQAGLDVYRSVYEYLYGRLQKERFKPPKIFDQLIEQGRLGLKTQSGFYQYKEGAVEAMKRERDRKLYARLRLFREEQKAVKKD